MESNKMRRRPEVPPEFLFDFQGCFRLEAFWCQTLVESFMVSLVEIMFVLIRNEFSTFSPSQSFYFLTPSPPTLSVS